MENLSKNNQKRQFNIKISLFEFERKSLEIENKVNLKNIITLTECIGIPNKKLWSVLSKAKGDIKAIRLLLV